MKDLALLRLKILLTLKASHMIKTCILQTKTGFYRPALQYFYWKLNTLKVQVENNLKIPRLYLSFEI